MAEGSRDLRSCIIPWANERRRIHERGFALPFVGEECGAAQLRLHVSVIQPGEAAHPPHSHAGEEIMYLLEGTAEAVIGDEKQVIGPHTALFCPEHVLHGLRNCGQTPMTYMVIRVNSDALR